MARRKRQNQKAKNQTPDGSRNGDFDNIMRRLVQVPPENIKKPIPKKKNKGKPTK